MWGFCRSWHDFVMDGEAYKTWVDQMMTENGPYNNPVSLEMLKDPYWQEPSDLRRPVVPQNRERGAEQPLGKPGGNAQRRGGRQHHQRRDRNLCCRRTDHGQAIANMDRELKARIGQAQIP